MDFAGSSALVTGGASGLGEAVVRALTARGTSVVVADLQDDKGQRVAADTGAVYLRTDVTDPGQVLAAVDAAVGRAPLRILVNCAGIGGSARTVGRDGTYESAFPIEKFTRIVTVNLVGTFNCVRLAATAMGRAEPGPGGERGAIVNTASVAAFEGQIGQAAYAASKAGIAGLTLPVARDLSVLGIRVNTIAPGLIDTPIYDGFPDPAAVKDRLRRDVVFPPRLGDSTEFASLTVELLGNGYLNGEVVRLDGGARLQPK
ncbi:SDR family NAD(P)-dependent oxidoreductase [Spirillospora sp. NPDC048819]|uniref:SDR family NAD(P)-dependent oxidoreductase n=1 Tax=Spirillospora sp. NPDC048819 TaxID=3155268 RepID=UPI0033EA5B34